MNHNETTIALYRALRDLGTAVYAAGIDLEILTEMNTAINTLQASADLVHALERMAAKEEIKGDK